MHLKSLTLKGFKSFASATTLHFEPGITAVVGPNGSGKSNVVDAIAWVLGEQGVKALRGGKMDDVIFAGTSGRPPLGRAEVTLTIDNSDGALPIAFDEVSITRRMFRDGAGEYEINGKACRLLDIQELLSDSGIGREMHVIVSQGHLDSVLSARPEDRRAFIEEAAGVLKHRKRKEKALRKLDSMQANLARLTDLTDELRRQLGPLGRQAEVARRAAGIQADLRDAKLRLLADDYVNLHSEMTADATAEEAAIAHRRDVQQKLAAAHAAQDAAVEQLAAAAPAVTAAQQSHFALAALSERMRGTVSLAQERARNLAVAQVPRAGQDPAELEAAADQAAAEQATKEEDVVRAELNLAAAIELRADREAQLHRAEQEVLRASHAIADRREGLARLTEQVNAARTRLAANRDDIERLSGAIAESEHRTAEAQQQFETVRSSIGALDSSETDLDEVHEAAATAAEQAQQRVKDLAAQRQGLMAEADRLRARIEALSLGLAPRDGAETVLAAARELPGVKGLFAKLLTVTPGSETAIAAALGPVADAVGVMGFADAISAVELLKASDGGRAEMVIGHTSPHSSQPTDTALPAGATWASDLVTAPTEFAGSVADHLCRIVVVSDLASARSLVENQPDLTAVTRDGDVICAHWAVGGSTSSQSTIELQAAISRAQQDLAIVTDSLADSDVAHSVAQETAAARAHDADKALQLLHESDAEISAVAEQLAQLGSAARSAQAETQRLLQRRQAGQEAEEHTRTELAQLEARLSAVETDDVPVAVDSQRRDELAAALSDDRQAEVDARLELRTLEERARASSGAASRLRRAAQQERLALQRAQQAAQLRQQSAKIAADVASVGANVMVTLANSLQAAASARSAAETGRAEAEIRANQSREVVTELQVQWDALTDSVHSTEVLRAQQRLRLEQLAQVAVDDYGINVSELTTEFGPTVPVPPPATEVAEYEAAKAQGEPVSAPMAMPYDRASAERRAKRAAREMAVLGKVNPLALEEFAAMEERHAFLAQQLRDLHATRADLLSVIGDVDEKILALFSDAFHDVAAEFTKVFTALFPGGDGSLHLTDPENMLTSGVDVVARPPGKKVKRLSLLSGGERSLVAVAMLVAIFRARPSPFYVLDEVEAALDEVNLSRLVGLLRELRHTSQLLVITHQKYTMEAADVLYGVSMRGDGISQVISQRLSRSAPGDDSGEETDGDDAHAPMVAAESEGAAPSHAPTSGNGSS